MDTIRSSVPGDDPGEFASPGVKPGSQIKGQSAKNTPSASRLGAHSVVAGSMSEVSPKSAKRKPIGSAGYDARASKNIKGTRYNAAVKSEEEKRQEFEKYRVEARTRATAGKYDQAIEMYTKALQLKNDHVECLVARATCYHELSEYDKALKDTEAALKVNPKHAKANHIKGEAHYQKGEFEFALVCFHRAKKIRRGVLEYDRDIKKAEGAIEASIGASSGAKLRIQDVTYFDNQNTTDSESVELLVRQTSAQRREALASRDRRRADKTGGRDPKTIKQLLGVLYGDWKYLEELLKEEDQLLDELDEEEREEETKRKRLIKEKREALKGGNPLQQVEDEDDKLVPRDNFIEFNRKKRRQFSETIREYTDRELTYLNERTEFWIQQKPPVKKHKNRPNKEEELTKEIIQQLENIEDAINIGNFDHSLKKARGLLKDIEASPVLRQKRKQELLGTTHSVIGCCYFEMKEYAKALESHRKDLKIAEQSNNEEALSRALDNVARTYAKLGDYRNAIKTFERKIPIVSSSLESTWLYHELGRCYLETDDYSKANQCAVQSVRSANEANDPAWQLNAYVLLAQTEVELKNYKSALEAFEKALIIAKIDDDEEAKAVITKAIADVNKNIETDRRNQSKESHIDDNNRPQDQVVSRPTTCRGERSTKSTERSSGAIPTESAQSSDDEADDKKNDEDHNRIDDAVGDHDVTNMTAEPIFFGE